jgi:AhpD family alkylhydroperoxidase
VTHLNERTQTLVGLRISQLNGCGVDVYGHSQAAKHAGETEERLIMIAAWRDAPFFTDAERAALDLAEWITMIARRGGAVVPVSVWAAAARHYDLSQLVALLLTTIAINLSNRAGTRNPLWSNMNYPHFREMR